LEQARQYYEQALQAAPHRLDVRYAYAQLLSEYLPDPSAYLDNLEQAVRVLEQANKNKSTQQMAELFFQHATAEPHILTDMPHRKMLIDRLQSIRSVNH
jgi:hypothetical protein